MCCGEGRGCWVKAMQVSSPLHSYRLSRPRIPTHTKHASPLQDRYSSPGCREESNRSLEKFALAAQKQTDKQASKQIKPKICLKITFVACVSWKSLIKKYALDFGDPKIFCSKRA